jgi:hypothetical protein
MEHTRPARRKVREDGRTVPRTSLTPHQGTLQADDQRHTGKVASLRTPKTIFALAALALGLSTLSPVQAQTRMHTQSPQAPLIAPGRLALPVTAFGAGAQITNQHIDHTANAIDHDRTLFDGTNPSNQGRRYTRFGGSGTLYEEIRLPATALTGAAPRWVGFMATAFPTTGAAQVVYARDTTYLTTAWAYCSRPDLVAVPGRYSTRSCQYHGNADQVSYTVVTGIQGNVVLAFYTQVRNDRVGSLAQSQADASTVARRAFALYAQLPVHRGPVPAGTLSVSTPVVVSPSAHRYQASIAGATVRFTHTTTYGDGSIDYDYDIQWDGHPQRVPDYYTVNAHNPDAAAARDTSNGSLVVARLSWIGGTPQTETTTNGWVVTERAPDGSVCRIDTGEYVATVAFQTTVWASDCTTATARTKAALHGVSAAISAAT